MSNSVTGMICKGNNTQTPTPILVNGCLRYNININEMQIYVHGTWTTLANGDEMQHVQEFEDLEIIDEYSVASVSGLTKNGLYRSTSQLTKKVLWFSIHDFGKTLIGIHDIKTIQDYTGCSDEELVIFAIKYCDDFK